MTHAHTHKKKPLDLRRYPAIPEPQPTIESLVQCIQALKEAVETLTGQRKHDQLGASAVTWDDLRLRDIEVTTLETSQLAGRAGSLIGKPTSET